METKCRELDHEKTNTVTIQRLLYAKEMTFKGKDGLTSVFCNLTNGSAWADSENNVSGARTGGSKGEPMMTAAEAGMVDTGSDGYRRSDKEGGGWEGVRIQLG